MRDAGSGTFSATESQVPCEGDQEAGVVSTFAPASLARSQD